MTAMPRAETIEATSLSTLDSPRRPPRIVIIGAGFGGLAAATGLAKADASVTVIDRRNYHLFQPLLYQVATAALSPADIATPIRAILRHQKNAEVLLAKVEQIDKDRREVVLEDRRVPYDHLVVATGARHAYFGHDEWERYAPGLKKIDDATELRRRILLAFEQAEPASPNGRPEEDAELRAALALLPERQRTAVFLRYYADLDYAAIGEALGITSGTVAATLNAAHAALRTRLEAART